MAGKAITTALTLEERVAEKMADVVGELITPNDMLAIVKKGIEKALFTEKVIKPLDSWGSTRTEPCLVDELTERHFEKAMRAGVERWLKDNPKVVQDAVSKAIDEGAFAAVQRVLDNRMDGVFDSAVEVMKAQGLLPAGQV